MIVQICIIIKDSGTPTINSNLDKLVFCSLVLPQHYSRNPNIYAKNISEVTISSINMNKFLIFVYIKTKKCLKFDWNQIIMLIILSFLMEKNIMFHFPSLILMIS